MANFNYNKVILGGRLTADPKLQTTPGGTLVTTFPVAVNSRFKGADGNTKALFVDVVAWSKIAEFVTTHFRKGSSICVTGELQSRSWTDKNGASRYTIEVMAKEVTFVDLKAEMPQAEVDPESPATEEKGEPLPV